MPGKKHVRGVGDKEQRQYEHIKEAAQKSGRYGKRAEEVAARTVLKQHKEKGHKQEGALIAPVPELVSANPKEVKTNGKEKAQDIKDAAAQGFSGARNQAGKCSYDARYRY